jgi:DNA helicase-2/ATP-dependent DNA helicase PcrA
VLTDLNQNQIKCVSCASGPVVVIAGAGTGKTTVLTKRIAYLIKHMHFNPYEILAITFTNKAANEMRNRVAKLLENEANGITIGTFHSLCLRILRVEIATIGNFNANFNVIDEEEQITIINDLIHDFKISLGKRQFTAKKIRAVISEAKRKGINLEEINDYGKMKALGVYDFDELKVIKLINIQYHKKLMENNLLDFDDLIIFVLAIFDEHPEIVNK